MLSNEQLNNLKREVPMYLLAQQKVKVERKGKEYLCLCPFHTEDTPSFTMYRAAPSGPDEGVWLYKCFGCGAVGNVFQLVEKLFSVSMAEAIQLVAKTVEDPEWDAKKARVDAVFRQVAASGETTKIPLATFASYTDALLSSPEAMSWLESRGISADTARRFNLGYVQTPLSQIVPTTHPWSSKGWVLFPEIRSENAVAVKYRSIMGKKIKDGGGHYAGFAQRPDMMKSPLYNLDAITSLEPVLVVEGELDCLTLEQAGFTTVSLPSASANITPDMRTALMAANARYMAGDMDEAGVIAMGKLHKELGGGTPKARTYWIKWPTPHKDANEFFLAGCGGDVDKFRAEVKKLMHDAKSRHVEGVRDLKEVMRNAVMRPMHENPRRMEFPWKGINSWVDILPGEVCFMFATETKMGKSTWWENILVHNALHGKKIVNFSAELSPDRYAQMVTANLLQKNRKNLTTEDMQSASEKMPADTFYFGYKPGAKMAEVLKLLAETKQVYGGDIFVIDPLHFIIRDSDNENRDTAAAMKACVDFAIKWDVIMIVVGQARKSMAGTRGKMAQGQDARGTAALGEDAATTFVLHRNRKNTEGGDESSPVYDNKTCIKLDYSRNSEPRSGYLMFDGEVATFRECLPETVTAPPTRAQELEAYFNEETDAIEP